MRHKFCASGGAAPCGTVRRARVSQTRRPMAGASDGPRVGGGRWRWRGTAGGSATPPAGGEGRVATHFESVSPIGCRDAPHLAFLESHLAIPCGIEQKSRACRTFGACESTFHQTIRRIIKPPRVHFRHFRVDRQCISQPRPTPPFRALEGRRGPGRGGALSGGRARCRVNTTTFLHPCRSCPLGERQPPPPEAVVRGACRRARLAPKESSTCSRRSASRRARARARWLTFLPTRPSTRPVRARPHCLCPVGTLAVAGLQNSARAGHEERDFTTPHHVLRTRKPSLDARPNGSPKLSLVPDGPP